jgi:hypothetical protein
MSAATIIPGAVITLVASVLADYYYSHRQLDRLFIEAGAPGDSPDGPGNCTDRCKEWLRRCNTDPNIDALEVLGGALRDFFEQDSPRLTREGADKERESVKGMLARYSLRYEQGGHVRGHLTATPSRTFEELLRRHDFRSVDDEFHRAMQSVDQDPASALTAACATLEAICLRYIEDEGLAMPHKKALGDLWPVVKASLGFDPKSVADDDLKKILGGIASVVDGIAAFRTHAGSAHGRERNAYRPRPRHARLGVHAAHTLASFIIETWDERLATRATA